MIVQLCFLARLLRASALVEQCLPYGPGYGAKSRTLDLPLCWIEIVSLRRMAVLPHPDAPTTPTLRHLPVRPPASVEEEGREQDKTADSQDSISCSLAAHPTLSHDLSQSIRPQHCDIMPGSCKVERTLESIETHDQESCESSCICCPAWFLLLIHSITARIRNHIQPGIDWSCF